MDQELPVFLILGGCEGGRVVWALRNWEFRGEEGKVKGMAQHVQIFFPLAGTTLS